MKRMLPVVLLAALGAWGFTLVQPQTPRFRWETFKLGAAYNTATAEEADFSNPLAMEGISSALGDTVLRTDGITCTWAIAGTGGTNGVDVKIVHEDGGIDCQCTLGACTATAGTALDCDCGSVIHIRSSNTSRISVQVDNATDCSANPAGMHCSVDFWR